MLSYDLGGHHGASFSLNEEEGGKGRGEVGIKMVGVVVTTPVKLISYDTG
jgi:hypothetical protein